MRSDLHHLPERQQRELERVRDTLLAGFEAAKNGGGGGTQAWRRGGMVLKIILFGSYARGDWVDAPLSANQYKSDYDILIIVNQKEMTDRAWYWARCEERLIRAYTIEKTLKTPVNFIVHSLQEVNDGLAHGRVFFMEITKDGIALYEADDRDLCSPKPKTPEQALAIAKEYFEEWMPSAAGMLETAKFSQQQKRLKDAAFLMHQTVERLYSCVLLTLTSYTRYNHNIAFLRSLAEGLDRRLFGIWPEHTHKERAMFQKLKDAYVKARYSKHYRISEEELAWLGERVEELGGVVHQLCTEKIAALEQATR